MLHRAVFRRHGDCQNENFRNFSVATVTYGSRVRMIAADFIHAHCPRIVNMTVTRARTPSLSELPGRYPAEPEFRIARKPVGSGGPVPAPKPVSAEDRRQQQKAAGQQMQRQVLQTMGVPRGSSPANKNGGPPSAAAPPNASSQRGPVYSGNRTSGRGKPADEVIPSDHWAITPQQYAALPKDENDPRVLFHTAFYGTGPQTLQPSLNAQMHGPVRTASGVSTQTYPPRTASSQPLSPNNGFPVLRNARSWQAVRDAGAPPDNFPVQSFNVPPLRPPKEAIQPEEPPPRPPKEPINP
jgi:hypothetical protein